MDQQHITNNTKKRRHRGATYRHSYMILLALMLTACGKEYEYSPGLPDQGDEVEMELKLDVPAATVATKVMTEAQENTLKTLDVLVFLDNGVNETFLYVTHGKELTPSGQHDKAVTARLSLRKSGSGEKHRLVLLGNLRNELDAVKDNFTTTMTKTDVLKRITFDAFDISETVAEKRIWDTTTPRYLPMWGESKDTHEVTSGLTATAVGTIGMIRSVATVDIVLYPDENGQPQGFGYFKLKEIKLYNTYQKGYAVPDETNINSSVAHTPTVASLPRPSDKSVAYKTADPSEEEYGISGQIYLAEADNTAGGVNLINDKQTCLLISGSFGTFPETWYRLDFIDKQDGGDLRLDILRNHRYTFKITSLGGQGYKTEEEALKSEPVNITWEIEVEDEDNKFPHIVFDGQYNLRLSQDSFYFYKEKERPQTLTLVTEHPDGWRVDDILEGDDNVKINWVRVSSENGVSGIEQTITITCTEDNTTSNAKKARIILISGKMRKDIHIYQDYKPEYSIEAIPSDLTFTMSAPTAQTIDVKVYPPSSSIYIQEIYDNSNPIGWLPGFGPSDHTIIPGNQTINLQPEVNNTGKLLSGTLLIYILDGDGNMVTSQVNLKQLAND